MTFPPLQSVATNVAKGYNVLTMDPPDFDTSEGRSRVDVFNYDAAVANGTIKFTEQPSATLVSTGKVLYTKEDFKKSYSGSVSIGASIPVVAMFSASTSLSKFKNTVTTQHSLQTKVESIQRDYHADVNLERVPLSDDFVEDAKDLAKGELNASEFVNKYGTSVVTAMDFGGRFIQTCVVSESEYTEITKSGVNVNVGAKATYKKVTGEFSTEQDTSDAKSFEKYTKSSSRKIWIVGGRASDLVRKDGNGNIIAGDVSAWMKTTKDAPATIAVTLESIWKTFYNSAFNGTDMSPAAHDVADYIQSLLPPGRPELTYSFEEPTLVWNDRGSGGDENGSYYRAKGEEPFRAVVGYGQSGYPPFPSAPVGVLSSVVQPSVLVEANFFSKIWADNGSGANQDGSFWWPWRRDTSNSWRNPRYVPLGVLPENGHSYPSTGAVSVVRVELAENANIGDKIWTDRGTGADHNFGSWAINPSRDETGFKLNAFWAWGSHGKPTPTITQIPPMVPKQYNTVNVPHGKVLRQHNHSSFSLTWNDKKSGGNKDGSFWRTNAPRGFAPVGDLFVEGYSAGGHTVKCYQPVEDAGSPAYLVAANDYIEIWNDRGSGARMSGAVWWPVVRDRNGWVNPLYVPLGIVTNNGYGKPPAGAAYLARADLCLAGKMGALRYNDGGTGADRSFACWNLDAESGEGVSSGTFFGFPSHRAPSPNPQLIQSPFVLDKQFVQEG